MTTIATIATITTDTQGRLTADSTITIGQIVAPIITHAAIGGRLAPRRIAETLESLGFRQDGRVDRSTQSDGYVTCNVNPIR